MIQHWAKGVLAASLAVWPIAVGAQTTPQPQEPATPMAEATPPQAAAAASVPYSGSIAAKTPVTIAVEADLDSKTAKMGDKFPISLVEPLTIGGVTLLNTGIVGEGEVIHAAKARAGGKGGELIVTARYLQCGTTRIPLGYFRLGGAGENRSGKAMAAAIIIASPAALFVVGGQVHIPKGSVAQAKITTDVALPAGTNCAGTANSTTTSQ